MMYPSLQNAPTDCTSTSWVFDTLEVHVPYGASDVGVAQPPLGVGLDDLVTNPDGIGFDTELEKELLRRIGRVIEESYQVAVPSEVKVLAQRVEELVRLISGKYAYFDAFKYNVKSAGGPRSEEHPKKVFPLSVVDWAVRESIDYEGDNGDWLIVERDKARNEIRDALLEAATVSWCVLYGINQAKSLAASKAAAGPRDRGFPIGFDKPPIRGPTIGIPGGQQDDARPPGGGGDGDGYVPPVGVTPEPLTPGDDDDGEVGTGTGTTSASRPRGRAAGFVTGAVILSVGYLLYRASQ
jgi:hypothetical protein